MAGRSASVLVEKTTNIATPRYAQGVLRCLPRVLPYGLKTLSVFIVFITAFLVA